MFVHEHLICPLHNCIYPVTDIIQKDFYKVESWQTTSKVKRRN